MISLKLSNIIENQAIFNFGTAGHVAHGKSTLVKSLTGVSTQRYKKEKERNITIKLGYANAKLFINRSTNQVFSFPDSTESAYDPVSCDKLELLYQISFVDCPGHQEYMATMVSGAGLMDYVLVVVAGNEPIPKPQTHQHLIALDYSEMPKSKMCYLLNKLDLVKPEQIKTSYNTLTNYLNTEFNNQDPVIIPISAATGHNLDYVLAHIASAIKQRIPETIKHAALSLDIRIARSYNINRPNTPINELKGAVIGGTILSGVVAINDLVEIRPGIINMVDGRKVIQPLIARVISLKSGSGNKELEYAVPGGLIGVNLSIYAGLSSDDKLKGQMVTHIGHGHTICDHLYGKFRTTEFNHVSHQDFQTGGVVTIIVDGVTQTTATIENSKIKSSKSSSTLKGYVSLKLKNPIVLVNKNIAIMVKGHLVAGLVVDNDGIKCSLPLHYTVSEDIACWKPNTWNIVDDLQHYQETQNIPNFDTLAKNITYVKTANKTNIILPKVTCRQHITFIQTTDLNDFIKSITTENNDIDLKHWFVKNMEHELSNSKPTFNDSGALLLKGRYYQNVVNEFCNNFCNKILKCPSCKTIQTGIVNDKLIERHCTVCKSITYLNSLMLKSLKL